MKCVEKNGTIRRVSDDEAQEMVKNQGWSFCSKTKYKEFKNPQVEEKEE